MSQTIFDEVVGTLSDYIETATHMRPQKRAFRLSRTGDLALNTFVREDAVRAADALQAEHDSCVLWDIQPIDSIRAENGWLLFFLSSAFFEQLCEKAAALEREPGEDYVSMRMRMLMRKPACPCPDNDRVHAALLRSLLADDRGHFTSEDDRAILIMTHGETGMRRVALENKCGTAAKALLMLRSPNRNNELQSTDLPAVPIR